MEVRRSFNGCELMLGGDGRRGQPSSDVVLRQVGGEDIVASYGVNAASELAWDDGTKYPLLAGGGGAKPLKMLLVVGTEEHGVTRRRCCRTSLCGVSKCGVGLRATVRRLLHDGTARAFGRMRAGKSADGVLTVHLRYSRRQRRVSQVAAEQATFRR